MTAPKNSTTLVEIIMAILLSVDFCVVFDVDVSFTLKKKVTSVSIVIVFLEIEVNVHNCRKQEAHVRYCLPEVFFFNFNSNIKIVSL